MLSKRVLQHALFGACMVVIIDPTHAMLQDDWFKVSQPKPFKPKFTKPKVPKRRSYSVSDRHKQFLKRWAPNGLQSDLTKGIDLTDPKPERLFKLKPKTKRRSKSVSSSFESRSKRFGKKSTSKKKKVKNQSAPGTTARLMSIDASTKFCKPVPRPKPRRNSSPGRGMDFNKLHRLHILVKTSRDSSPLLRKRFSIDVDSSSPEAMANVITPFQTPLDPVMESEILCRKPTPQSLTGSNQPRKAKVEDYEGDRCKIYNPEHEDESGGIDAAYCCDVATTVPAFAHVHTGKHACGAMNINAYKAELSQFKMPNNGKTTMPRIVFEIDHDMVLKFKSKDKKQKSLEALDLEKGDYLMLQWSAKSDRWKILSPPLLGNGHSKPKLLGTISNKSKDLTKLLKSSHRVKLTRTVSDCFYVRECACRKPVENHD